MVENQFVDLFDTSMLVKLSHDIEGGFGSMQATLKKARLQDPSKKDVEYFFQSPA